MQKALFRSFLTLGAMATLCACVGLGDARQAPSTYEPRVAADGSKNPQLAADLEDCKKRISDENAKGLSAQQYMVELRGCLIQRGHVMLN
jgi:hypothetical protein